MNWSGHFTLSRMVKEFNEGLKVTFDYVTQLIQILSTYISCLF